jgi:hypothetical protein
MRVVRVKDGEAVVELSGHELIILNNALNEVSNALDLAEFSTRMGAERDEALALLHQIGEAANAARNS